MFAQLKIAPFVFCVYGLCAMAAYAAEPLASSIPSAVAALPAAALQEGPDESGLRYYASQGQTARVDKEIERLKRLYPNWTPPEHLSMGAGDSVDEEAFWDLYSEDRIDELHLAIEARQASEPNWHPSSDLMTKLRSKDLRRKVMQYWKDGKWQNLVDYVKANEFSGDSGDVELVWTLAEAHARIKQNKDAAAIYQSILVSNVEQAQRQATLQKAMAFLRINDIEPLIAVARPSDVDLVRIDLTRMRMSAFLHDEDCQKVSDADMADFEAYARGSDDANQLGLIAWYLFKRRAYFDSLEWFKKALERNGDAMVAHGLALALMELGQRREAEEVAYVWRGPLVNNAILFIDMLEPDLVAAHPAYIEPERLLRYGQVTVETASGLGAQALAWYAYNTCQFTVARDWFARAMAWHPKQSTVLGYALTLQRLKMRKDYFDVINRYDGLFPQVLSLVFPDQLAHDQDQCASDRRAPLTQVNTLLNARMVMGRDVGMPAVAAPQAMPVLNKAEFPIAVAPENALRFFTAAGPMAVVPNSYVREPIVTAPPLVARRVNGVGVRPYEKWGFSLLPSWSGAVIPSHIIAADQMAPAGTQWALEGRDGDVPVTHFGVSSSQPSRDTMGPSNGVYVRER